uniref:Ionotropic receptor n=1 Tax=Meloidogyne javanica TaxID=6303 RepID=A0A915LPK8_MELJA
MNNKIRILFARNPPDAFDECRHFPTLKPSVECPFPGWCVEIISYLTEYLKLKIEPFILNNQIGELNWGSNENGTWNGVLGFIQNNTVDTACLFFQRTQLRAEHFSFSYPITNVKPTYVVHSQHDEWNIWNAFMPYSPSTWFSMGVMLILQTLFCLYVAKLEIMQCRLLLDMYQTLLLSALLQPVADNPFRDAREMVRLIGSQRFKLITNYIGNWYFEELHNSNVSHYRSLRLAIAQNPIHIASTVPKALDKVLKGGYIYPIQEDSIGMQMAKERCGAGLVFVSEGMPEVSSHLIFRRDSRFVKLFERSIIMNLDFVRRTFKKYFHSNFKLTKENFDNYLTKNLTERIGHHCKEESSFSSYLNHKGRWHFGINGIELKPLDFGSMFGVMLVALLGLLLSFLAFCSEIYYNRKKKRLMFRLRMRRALAEQAHLTAAAQVFVKQSVQTKIGDRLQSPTIGELHACFGEIYI